MPKFTFFGRLEKGTGAMKCGRNGIGKMRDNRHVDNQMLALSVVMKNHGIHWSRGIFCSESVQLRRDQGGLNG
eukprot:scaffold119258_cov18-Prasinocladus_malaysianus.AAC.1